MRWWILLILALVGAGCGQKPDEVVDEGSRSVVSWDNTLEMACGQWAEYQVPTLYVRQTMKAGEEALGKQLQKVEKLGADQKAQKVVRKIYRLRNWIEEHQQELAKAEAKKRR